jgi:2-keto-4-pentenoate hydratase/2-oxohepta-3-ene-1,7-dioic acid hydratase in catechol pathway
MKLLRVGPAGHETPAALDTGGVLRDLSGHVPDIAGEALLDPALDALRALDLAQLPALPGDIRIGPCVGHVGKVVCIGLNYSDHAAEAGMPVPTEPILFLKASTAICGPYDDVLIPRGSTKPDWEVELGIVIGRRTSYLDSVDEARDAIAGYCVVNDVSERAFQMERGGQWSKGKSCETFNPAGPWLVTPDEIDDVLALDMWLDVSGVRRQTGTTSTMIFDPYYLVHYLSQFLVLEPGDLINTGTPPGVGLGFKPPVWLQPGDVMELGITGLGTQRQNVLPPR